MLGGAVLGAGPARAEVDCFPHAAPAPYSSAAHPQALPVATLRPSLGGGVTAAPGAPPARTHAVTWRRPGGHPRLHHVAHRHPGVTHIHRRLAAASAPPSAPALGAPGVDASSGGPLSGLTHVAIPEACAPARAPITVGPTIAAIAPPGGIAGFIGPLSPGDTAATGTAVDTTTTTPGEDTATPTTPGLVDQPPEVVIAYPGTPGVVIPPGGVVPGGGVPEPSSWALMLCGLFGAGAALRVARRTSARP
jgi:hypothetical protein